MPVKKTIGDYDGADFELNAVPQEALGEVVASSLASKGFCAIGGAVCEDVAKRLLEDVAALSASGRLRQPPSEIAAGLLGPDGSALIAELSEDTLAEVLEVAPALQEAESTFANAADALSQHGDSLGFRLSHRTSVVVHEAGLPDVAPALTAKEVAKWFNVFVSHRVMMILFVGPGTGLLRMRVYADEDADCHELRTRPGMLVLLRPDLTSHEHLALGRAFALTCFLLSGGASEKRRRAGGGTALPPPAVELDRWATDALLAMKRQGDDEWDPDMPREWQRAMNLYCSQEHMIAIHGIGARLPSCEGPETWFRTQASGPDVVTQVPLARWDHDTLYDPKPESWKYGKTFCKHGGFMEGAELFDNKHFGISVNEARSMDPNQRHLLEMAYESLYRMGKRKGTLMNAHGSVYVGNQAFEFAFADIPKECQCLGPTGNGGCIAANRISYVLGMKGPSIAVDTDTASSMSALYLTAESLQQKGRGKSADFGVALGCATMTTPAWWSQHCALGFMTFRGRCFTFDAKANGYVRSEACIGAAMRPHAESVDGQMVADPEARPEGLIAGICLNNCGQMARITAASGEADQDVVAETARQANVSPLDVDVAEPHGCALLLADAIEVAALRRVHRQDTDGSPLALSSIKSVTGHTMEAGGITALLKLLLGAQWGVVSPGLHLRELNPHIDLDDGRICLVAEATDTNRRASFSGVLSKGFGGTNGYCISHGSVDEEKVVPSAGPLETRPTINFWPGGGGELRPDQTPESGYYVAGSWNMFTGPELMEHESADMYGYTVTVGERGWEHFHILLDGDPDRALHPGGSWSSMESAVLGPDSRYDAEIGSWLLDASSDGAAGAVRALGDAGEPPAIAGPVARYRIRLSFAGKWRRVDWQRLPGDAVGRSAIVH